MKSLVKVENNATERCDYLLHEIALKDFVVRDGSSQSLQELMQWKEMRVAGCVRL